MASNEARPALRETCRSLPEGGSRMPNTRVRKRSRLATASSTGVSGINSRNSSPPQRPRMSVSRSASRPARANSCKHVIARGVPAAVVDVLEVIHVDQRERQRLARRLGKIERRERELLRAAPVRQSRQRVLARELHELHAVAAVREQEVNEQRDDPDARDRDHGIPAQLLRLAIRLLLGVLELALEREVALDLTVGLESRPQGAGLTDALGVVRRM